MPTLVLYPNILRYARSEETAVLDALASRGIAIEDESVSYGAQVPKGFLSSVSVVEASCGSNPILQYDHA